MALQRFFPSSILLLLMMLFLETHLFAAFPDLEESAQDFVLETKQIEIPGHPYAFNPSILQWNGRLLMSFRILPDPKQSFTSLLGVVWLDENFYPVGSPQILNTREVGEPIPSRAGDGRLLCIGDRIFFVYDDNPEPKISKGGFRVYLSELYFDGKNFSLINIECLSRYEGESRNIREKNWAPFDYHGNLLLAYSQIPHLIFLPIRGTGECVTVACSQGDIQWKWGVLRGGTPGLLVGNEYLAFFHSSIKMPTVHSEGKEIDHYFMGAYTFAPEPPFYITQISPKPIISKNYYHGPAYKPYWKPVKVVFPGGYVFDDQYIWIVFGKDDHEMWMTKLDKKKLLQSLIPVSNILRP